MEPGPGHTMADAPSFTDKYNKFERGVRKGD